MENFAFKKESLQLGAELTEISKLIPGIKIGQKNIESANSSSKSGRGFPDSFSKILLSIFKHLPGDEAGWDSLKEADLKEYADKKKISEAFDRLKNQVVIDLGANSWTKVYNIASQAGAMGYVGVDKFHGNSDEFVRNVLKEHNSFPLPAGYIEEDMLTFLKRLPDSSVSIVTSGMDLSVMNDLEYIKKVECELRRVLSSDGVYLNYDSVFNIKNNNVAETSFPNRSGGLDGLKIYKKAAPNL